VAAVKRFWAAVEATDGAVLLDGRPIRTPKGAPLSLPTPALADAVAAEWAGVGERVDPRAMPLTGLANAAIDVVAADRAGFAAGLAAYAETDLTCYRAEGPQPLVARQVAAWEPPLKAVERAHGLVFRRTAGVIPVGQPAATLERVGQVLAGMEPFVLAPLSTLVRLSGSVVLALAVEGGVLEADAALAAAEVDAAWQTEHWGRDTESEARDRARRDSFLAAARFLALARPSRNAWA
jgi:chaperone required for assembly of F1-ATPase